MAAESRNRPGLASGTLGPARGLLAHLLRAATALFPRLHDDAGTGGVAALATVLILWAGLKLLLAVPLPRPPAPGQLRIQLRLVSAEPARPLPSAPDQGQAAEPGGAGQRSSEPRPTGLAGFPAPAAGPRAPVAPPAAAPAIASAALYDAHGRPRIPPGALPRSPEAANRPDPLHRTNPVDYRGTRFEDEWIGGQDLGERAGRQIARGQQKLAELVFGKEIEHAKARPPPQVRFNPSRHEQSGDLGSEATGDAWKAAPISFEPAPGLAGVASSRIGEQLLAVEREHAACPPARVQSLLVPAREQLVALRQAERAWGHGADPVRAQQLPAAANAAYDLARRALWYARQQLEACRG
jgi:hypothetical protein